MKKLNTKKQGDVGVGMAIAHFVAFGITVSIPLTDSQDYDIVIDLDGLKKVQVKTTTYIRKGEYEVMLKTCGGNKTGSSIKTFCGKSLDYLFILTESGNKYLIPTNIETPKHSLRLGKKYDIYKV